MKAVFGSRVMSCEYFKKSSLVMGSAGSREASSGRETELGDVGEKYG